MMLLPRAPRLAQGTFGAVVILLLAGALARAQDNLTIAKEFNLITSKNAAGYFKPLFTTIGESFNSNAYTVARFGKQIRFGIDISACGMMIPSSQLTYDALLPEDYFKKTATGKPGDSVYVTQTAELRDGVENRNHKGTVSQPTIYGGVSTPTFSASQSAGSAANPPKQPATVTYLEGNNISFMAGLPTIQLALGLPTQTQIRLRLVPVPIQDNLTIYYGAMISQQFNHLIGLFADDSLIGVAINAGYHSVTRLSGISVSSYAVGLHASKTWNSGLSIYGGVQYENMSGTISFIRDPEFSTTAQKSPFQEIRDRKNLDIDVSSFTDIRAGVGVSYKVGILELHADAAYASQPVFAAGLTLWFLSKDVSSNSKKYDEGFEINKGKGWK